MKNSDIPCKPDCPERNIHCHGTCPDYIEFRKKKDAENEMIFNIKYEERLQGRERYSRYRKKK